MKIRNKILFTLAVVVLLAAGCNKTEPVRDLGTNDANLEQSNQQQSSSTDRVAPSNIVLVHPGGQGIVVSQTVEGTYEIVAGIKVATVSYTIDSNIADALSLLKVGHKVQTKSYGDIGEFVESIDGIKSDSKHFWEFFVNGKSSNVGASSYKLQNGDKIEWKLSSIK